MKQIITTILLVIFLNGSSQTGVQKFQPKRIPGKILGADISFLPQLEARGKKFYDHGVEKDAILILKDHGFNYIRLRIFNNPSADSGYSPDKGFCDLEHTLEMARRIKAAGMKFLLDFHYSDNWADPGKQFKPYAWRTYSFPQIKGELRSFTSFVLQNLKEQNTLPDMVQIGNEINHGIVWPDAEFSHVDKLADLLKSGIAGVRDVDSNVLIMLHIALGGQLEESRSFLDSILKRGVQFDIIGESYYPKWHGTIADLKKNLEFLADNYKQDVVVVEYSEFKQEVNDIAFHLPNNKGKGSFIWEPLNTWDAIFDKDGNANEKILVYDGVAKKEGLK
jgi:arabinogalactan endo-1,4-beta-galactosidase